MLVLLVKQIRGDIYQDLYTLSFLIFLVVTQTIIDLVRFNNFKIVEYIYKKFSDCPYYCVIENNYSLVLHYSYSIL